MNEETKQLIQELTNAVSNSRRFVYAATKEFFYADDVYAQIESALSKANAAGFENTNPEPKTETRW